MSSTNSDVIIIFFVGAIIVHFSHHVSGLNISVDMLAVQTFFIPFKC